MNRTEIERLAQAGHALRPDWPWQSLVTWLEKNLKLRPYRDAAVAMAWVATDEATTSPGRLLVDGPWWSASLAGDETAQPTRDCPAHHLPEPCRPCAEYQRTVVTDPARIAAIRAAERNQP